MSHLDRPSKSRPAPSSPRASRALAALLGVLVLGAPATPTRAQVIAPQKGVAGPIPSAAPLSLTASDGSGLELVSLAAQAVVEDPLAFTELRLTFRNPQNRVREGRFRITLPSGATISRFAMRIGDAWQEGEIVEQHAARVAYEDFLHRRQDPALLEAEAGNEFSARVFPIPPNATKELIVSYSQELPRAGEAYRLPLYGLPRVGHLAIRALVNRAAGAKNGAPASSLGGARIEHEVVEVTKQNFKPDRDFEVVPGGGNARAGLRHENLVVARIVPLADSDRRDDIPSLQVLFDTSASRALGLTEQVRAFEAVVAELRKHGDPMVTVTAFDQDVATIFNGRASAMGDTVRKKVMERRALGASDLERALAAVTIALRREPRARVLLVSDGVVTAGSTEADKVRAAVKGLGAAGVGRIDALAVGGIRDDVMLGRIVTGGLARDGVVLDATLPAATLARKLMHATRSGVKLSVEGAGWVWPSVLNGIQPGDSLLVYADLPGDRPLRLKVDGAPLNIAGALASVERPLLARAWAQARISRLLEQRDAVASSDRDVAEALRRQVIDVSIKNRVLSPYTSLLVLETEADYARFGIERRALADILTVGAGGLALIHRTELPATAVATQPVLDQVANNRPSKGRTENRAKAEAASRKMAKREISEDLLAGGSPTAELAAKPADDLLAAGNLRGSSGMQKPAELGGLAPPPVALPEPAPTVVAVPASAVTSVQRPAAPRPAARPRTSVAMQRSMAPAQESRLHDTLPEGVIEAVPPRGPAPVEGQLKDVLELINRRQLRDALVKALSWRQHDAGDVLALVALGEAFEALGNTNEAGRAYGSLIDLFPGRADMRRFAGERLERVRGAAALALAVDTYRKAVEQRPDHPASHRLLGFALLKQGHPRAAFDALAAGRAQTYPAGRFRGVERILAEDLGLAAAMWTRYEPARGREIQERLARAGGTAETAPSLRFIVNWETDANDVDFHIFDAKGGHAYYSSPVLPSGGSLYADVTTGYGPECFTIRGRAAAGPYRLQAHYYRRGPMGYGMGKLEVVEHDGRGHLRFEERPFVVMQDGAFVDLGRVQSAFGDGGAPMVAR